MEPDWNINIGLPAENYHDEQLSEYYKDVVAEAWRLSDSNNEISHEDIGETGGEESLDAEKIETFPEFVPQISAYVKSPQRSKGLHSLIDIGAGTVDICVFNIWETEDEDDKFPVFAKDVKNLGLITCSNTEWRKADITVSGYLIRLKNRPVPKKCQPY